MPTSKLTIAVGINDRTLPLIAGQVGFDGLTAEFVTAPLEEIFARAFDEQAYDVTELSFSNYLYLTALDESPYVGLPIFPSRSFRHSAIYIRTDRGIAGPRDLKGRTIGVREYSMTAALVARGMLEDEYGVGAQDISWRFGKADGDDSQPIARMQPEGVELKAIPPQNNLSDMLRDGELDAMIAYKPPPAFLTGQPDIARLFEDYPSLEKDYGRRTRIFPIMHLIGIRRELVASSPGLAVEICNGFDRARLYSQAELAKSQALYSMLPWGVADLNAATNVLGDDFWAYGVQNNRPAIEALCRYSSAQGIAPRQLDPEELFAAETLDWVTNT